MKTFNPTTEQLTAAKAVFMAMALEESIRPIVESYQLEILQRHNFTDRHNGERITSLKNAWTMSEDDFQIYLSECNQAKIAAGLKVESEAHCPLLVAESLTREAKRVLVDSFKPMFQITAEDLFACSLGRYRDYVELLLKLSATYMKENSITINI